MIAKTARIDPELAAFRAVNFDWTRQLKSVWRESPYEVTTLHAGITEDILTYFGRVTHEVEPDNEPRGCVVIGPAGHGKTHLMGRLRRAVWDRKGWFVLLDLVGVKDFWSSVALGFLNSLQVKSPDGMTQYGRLILGLADKLGIADKAVEALKDHGRTSQTLMPELARLFRNALNQQYRAEIRLYRDVVTALILLDSEDLDQHSIAHAWLQGMDLDLQQLRPLGFFGASDPGNVVKGLSWLMSLVAPTLIAVDQIDAIVSAANIQNHSPSAKADDSDAKAVVEQLSQGLMDLYEVKHRAVVVLSCLEDTWHVIGRRSTAAVTDRFRLPLELEAIPDGQRAIALVQARLARAYEKAHFTPPYPTWPFRLEAFAQVAGLSPRELLKKCDHHRLACVHDGKVSELVSFEDRKTVGPSTVKIADLDALYAKTRAGADIAGLLTPEREDDLRELFVHALWLLPQHFELPDDVDCGLQSDPDQKRPSLHGRMTFTFRAEGDREAHFCFRVLQHANHLAFQSRLKAAITASGIGRGLSNRHLFLLRNETLPDGPKSRQLIAELRNGDGNFITPREDDLRAFVALKALAGRPDFPAWVHQRKPLFETPLFREAGLCPPAFLTGGELDPRGSAPVEPASVNTPSSTPAQQLEMMDVVFPPPATGKVAKTRTGGAPQKAGTSISGTPISDIPAPEPTSPDDTPASKATPQPTSTEIIVGYRSGNPGADTPVVLPVPLLNRHIAVFAGSGSGKTVLLRRLVEEAAIAGIPSIVLDVNNDLARLGDAWPSFPDDFTSDDAVKAEIYQKTVDVVVWTPGIARGNPLVLNLLPDFAAIGDGRDLESEDERSQAVEMARSTLEPYIIGKGQKANQQRGVLADTLRLFALKGGRSLRDLIDLLDELPEGCSEIRDAERHARDMADQLRAAISTNPLLRSDGQELDPKLLFHGPDGNRPRISVINLSGLPSEAAREAFVNQLQMTLFTWVKKHPSPSGRLYVLDEAQNFAPSQTNTACRASTRSLAAQARKYGLGMIFATQAPRGIDNGIVSNCTTHFYGRMSSPNTIEATRDLMRAKGGDAEDLGKLVRGMFYFSTEGLRHPVKISTPLCLSWHPANPPAAAEVIQRAHESANRGRNAIAL